MVEDLPTVQSVDNHNGVTRGTSVNQKTIINATRFVLNLQCVVAENSHTFPMEGVSF